MIRGQAAGTIGISGPQVHSVPQGIVNDYTVLPNDYSLNFTGGATITVTLPSASGNPGRFLLFRNLAAFTVVSVASNVIPIIGGATGTAILAATAGKFALLQSNGTAWEIMAAN